MCGITVYISKCEQDDNKLSSIRHRGPDCTIINKFKHKDYFISMAFHRLAIIDINHGDQPFVYKSDKENRQVYMVCNGEIYNYKTLIRKYSLQTKSDCNVILELYLQNNDIYRTVQELNGEFAFVLIDIKDDKMQIIYGRDRFGIRPLFHYADENGFYFSSELKGLPFEGRGKQVKPRKIHVLSDNLYSFSIYYNIGKKYDDFISKDYDNLLKKVRKTLTDSVIDRMNSERPLGALLSGGLDSSLVCGIASKMLLEKGERLRTFTIAIEKNATDVEYARNVAKHINSIHHEIIIPVEKWIETLEEIIKQIETYDITTIRASCGQYLISKWISENTNIKVLLIGDGSDEICAGYKYFFNAPNAEESHKENIRLLDEIHRYDVLRCDRGISAWGIEARVPFLSKDFVDLYLSVDPELRNPIKNKRIEKYLLRKSFDEGDGSIIPINVLYRSKEAFSDGVSSVEKSWFEYIQEYIDSLITDEEFEEFKHNFPSKEAYWYKKIYDKYYPHSNGNFHDYWMPKWTNENNKDPSARKLKSVY